MEAYTMKSRTGSAGSSPRSAFYTAKPRKEGISYKSIYIALLCGALCVSCWSLLGHQLSSSGMSLLPGSGADGGSGSIWSQSSTTEPGSLARTLSPSGRGSSSSLQLAELRQKGRNASAEAAGGSLGAATAAGFKGGAKTLLAFQRTRTAMPFIMMICRMCADAPSNALQASKLYDPVTSTLLEHALSNEPGEQRVFVELGPGSGYFSMLAASWQSDVVAFEPTASARLLLDHNAALHKDGRMKVVPYAVGAKTTLAAIVSKQATASNGTTGNSTSTGNSTAEAAKEAGSSEAAPASRFGADIVALSDAISGDASVSVLMINAPALDGVSVPPVEEAVEGAHNMLKHVQWVFVTGLQDSSSPRMRAMLAGILQHGNFSNMYNYGSPPSAAAAAAAQQADDAQYEPGAAQQQQQQPATATAAASVPYPADTHYVEVTETVLSAGKSVSLRHNNFLFSRKPINETLTINVPKVIWDWTMLASLGAANTTAAPGAAGTAAQQPAAASAGTPAAAQAAAAVTVGAGAAAAVPTPSSSQAGFWEGLPAKPADPKEKTVVIVTETRTVTQK